MKTKAVDRIIIVLVILCALLLAGMGFIAYQLFFSKENPAAPLPTQTPQAALPMREDLLPDSEKLYQVYDGTLAGENGATLALSDLRGQTTVLLYWSSWCSDCENYLKNSYSEAAEALSAAGARLVLVCREGVRGDTLEKAQAALAEDGITAEIWMDTDAALYQAMGFHSVPALAVLDGQGKLEYQTSVMPTAEELAAIAVYADSPLLQAEQFVTEKLMTQTGGLVSSYRVIKGAVTQGDTVLSESMGLMMLQALENNDQVLFDTLWDYVRNAMSVNDLAAWQVVSHEKANVNASLDDLRIAEALALADQRFGGYEKSASACASALYDACVRDGQMRDFAEFDTGNVSQQVTLCYQDTEAMLRIAEYDARWQKVAENARGLLQDENALFSAEFPFYYPTYDTQNGTYAGESIQMSEALLALLHAAQAGCEPTAALNWLEETLQNGALYAVYTANGEVKNGYNYESTGSYALLVQLAAVTGRGDLMRAAMIRMEKLRCFTAPMVGGYGAADSTVHYVFDELEALAAWRIWQK